MMEERSVKGYGVILPWDHINEQKFKKFLEKHSKTFENFLSEYDDEQRDCADFLIGEYYGGNYGFGGLHAMIADVIHDEDGEEIAACTGASGNEYLLCEPAYPWSTKTKLNTKEKVEDLLLKYFGEIYDDDTEFEFGEYECVWAE